MWNVAEKCVVKDKSDKLKGCACACVRYCLFGEKFLTPLSQSSVNVNAGIREREREEERLQSEERLQKWEDSDYLKLLSLPLYKLIWNQSLVQIDVCFVLQGRKPFFLGNEKASLLCFFRNKLDFRSRSNGWILKDCGARLKVFSAAVASLLRPRKASSKDGDYQGNKKASEKIYGNNTSWKQESAGKKNCRVLLWWSALIREFGCPKRTDRDSFERAATIFYLIRSRYDKIFVLYALLHMEENSLSGCHSTCHSNHFLLSFET